MIILGIETSCDETAAAVLTDGPQLLSSVVNSQVDIHGRYGGVVPELASRQHLLNIGMVVDQAMAESDVSWQQLDIIAVTRGPGLIGSLLVGLNFAKAVSLARGIPLVPVDHIGGHLAAVHLENPDPPYPHVALVASGGHTSIFLVEAPGSYQLLGRTLDDAAGEAFDKVAKLLSLGYPGGPVISRLAAKGDPRALAFPRAWLDADSFDFSFSGLKTAVAHFVREHPPESLQGMAADICASFQEAVVEVLCEKTLRAASLYQVPAVVLAGGVAANPRLRQLLSDRCQEKRLAFLAPSPALCTDNGAMIAMAAMLTPAADNDLSLDVYSRAWFLHQPGSTHKHTFGPRPKGGGQS